jgi:hypothetical protein
MAELAPWELILNVSSPIVQPGKVYALNTLPGHPRCNGGTLRSDLPWSVKASFSHTTSSQVGARDKPLGITMTRRAELQLTAASKNTA